jgi:hypothetical protein
MHLWIVPMLADANLTTFASAAACIVVLTLVAVISGK